MLSEVIRLTPQLHQPAVTASVLTDAVIKLATPESEEHLKLLSNGAIALLDQYLTVGSDNSAHNEKSFIEVHNGDLNGFLKAEHLGRDSHSPLLTQIHCHTECGFQYVWGKRTCRRSTNWELNSFVAKVMRNVPCPGTRARGPSGCLARGTLGCFMTSTAGRSVSR